MPRDINGNYSLPTGVRPSDGDTAHATQLNTPLDDIAAAISASLDRNGSGGALNNIDMNGYTLLNLGASSDDNAPARNSDITAVRAEMRRFNPPGRIMIYRGKTAPQGWIPENGGTIGNVGSGATNRANDDTQDLYVHLWNTFTNTELPIQSNTGTATTRGATAIADFNAGKRMPLFDARNRYPRAWVSGLSVGQAMADEIRDHTHTGTTNPFTQTVPSRVRAEYASSIGAARVASINSLNFAEGQDSPMVTLPSTATFTTDATGGSETRPLTSVYLFLISL